ncbi:LysR substrate-binding domain-containing protein [Pseudooceanicola sp. HF7]|uniref:LysR substrate-binding domain-containing protein n=1 Tax=Pseudooceanicola sp. HF7 TaxID=2721560 RepID=UPI00142FEB20|nr:LysR substrate-binding domain-containing protein [Pseudooceanicola sp. HF7]NIZ11365.1 LysR family transcriptional regulator [Pseudooceanicola sp. HF7]
MQRVPSTQALRALESFSRLGTVWQAAEELHLTKSAVSHQLRQLERELGFPLTTRSGTRLELTPLGRGYAADIRRALDILANSAVQSATRGITGHLTVSAPPAFASNWLCRVIDSFIEAYPEVNLRLVTPRRLDDVSSPDVDLFVAFGQDFTGNVEIETLEPIEYTPLCSPAYLNRFDRFPDPSRLAGATLLHLVDKSEWDGWLRLMGQPMGLASRGIIFSDMNLVYSAAMAGQGIAMGDEFVCGEALDRGLLVRPFSQALPTENAYCLAVPRDRADTPVRDAFLGWLREALRNR